MKNEKNKKLILYPFNIKLHSIHRPTIELFSKKYKLKYSPSKKSILSQISKGPIKKYYYLLIKIVKKILGRANLKQKLKLNSEKNLLFCLNKLPPQGYDFILDLEMVTALSNYNYREIDKEYIAKRLADQRCKAIICWNKASYFSLIKTIDYSKFKNKIKIIPFGRKSSKIKKYNKRKLVNLIFISSINNPNDFEKKGGLITLEAYSKLAKKYENIKLFVRSRVNNRTIKKYKDVPGLIFINDELSKDQIKKLFLKTDILLEPIPGISLMLECMDYKIPVVAFDFWCIPEMVINNKSGFLIDSSKIFGNKKNMEDYLRKLNSNYNLLSNRGKIWVPINKFIEKIDFLINSPSLLRKMEEYQRGLLKEGRKYSLSKRNKELIKVIDSALE